MRVALIAKPGGLATGVGRYTRMLQDGLQKQRLEVLRVAPTVPPFPSAGYALARRLGADIQTFLTTYPIWANYPRADIYHLTSQNLATLLLFRRPPGKVVITVHDIIPYLLRHDPALCSYRTAADRVFDRLAMAGLKRADALIADSRYTKRCVVEQLGIPSEKIEVIYLGIDHARFRPLAVPPEIRARYGLPEGRRYLIYVGSEDPRKNLGTLIRALAEVRQNLPNVELIKVGRAHFTAQRQRLVDLATALGVLSAIHFLDEVPEADLPLLYNLAEVCVMPSRYEGFGFPVLEAMACGTPVVCADAASLPELAGADCIHCSPDSILDFSRAIEQRLAEGCNEATRLATRRVAMGFRWEHTASSMRRAYSRLSTSAKPQPHAPREENPADPLEA